MHSVETLGIVHIIKRSCRVLCEQSGEEHAQRRFVCILQDVPGKDDATRWEIWWSI